MSGWWYWGRDDLKESSRWIKAWYRSRILLKLPVLFQRCSSHPAAKVNYLTPTLTLSACPPSSSLCWILFSHLSEHKNTHYISLKVHPCLCTKKLKYEDMSLNAWCQSQHVCNSVFFMFLPIYPPHPLSLLLALLHIFPFVGSSLRFYMLLSCLSSPFLPSFN